MLRVVRRAAASKRQPRAIAKQRGVGRNP